VTTPTPLDETYILDAQDPNEPVWESDSNIAGMQNVDDPDDMYEEKTPAIRAASGAIHFLNDLEEVVHDFLAEPEEKPYKAPKLDAIRTRELGSDKWRPGRRQVTAAMTSEIVTESANRRQVTLVNYGPNVCYLSSISAVAGAPNTVQLLVSSATFWAPLTIPTKDDIWAVCAATQTASVEVVEVFDQEC
jgi:hypothetical protein